MKIRHKITLWITCAGLLAGLLFDQEKRLIYRSSLTNAIDLSIKNTSRYNVSTAIPATVEIPDQDDNGDVTFRVRLFSISYAGHEYLVQIARSMEKLQEEITDLFTAVAIGLVGYTITLLVIGYFVAGKILRPISDINGLVREISEKTLDKRIPLSGRKSLLPMPPMS